MKEIIIEDKHFHTVGKRRYPRVTSIVAKWPKNEAFEKWMGDAPSYADAMETRDKAGERGRAVHQMIERLVAGETFEYTPALDYVWKYLESFAAFWEEFKPSVIAQELLVHSPKWGVSGTIDMVAKINDKVILLDWKSSNALHYEHELQVAAYSKLYRNLRGRLDETWLVRLGSRHKRGYELKDISDDEDNLFANFRICAKIFDQEYGREPKDRKIRASITL